MKMYYVKFWLIPKPIWTFILSQVYITLCFGPYELKDSHFITRNSFVPKGKLRVESKILSIPKTKSKKKMFSWLSSHFRLHSGSRLPSEHKQLIFSSSISCLVSIHNSPTSCPKHHIW